MSLHHPCTPGRRALIGLPEEVIAGMCRRWAGGLDAQPEVTDRNQRAEGREGEKERKIEREITEIETREKKSCV